MLGKKTKSDEQPTVPAAPTAYSSVVARQFWRRGAAAILLTLAALAAVWLLALTPPVEYLRLQAYDSLLGGRPTARDNRVCLILIDAHTRAVYREPAVLWNRHYRDLLPALAQAGAKVAGVNIFSGLWMPGCPGRIACSRKVSSKPRLRACPSSWGTRASIGIPRPLPSTWRPPPRIALPI